MFSSVNAIDSIHMFDEEDPNTPLKKIMSPLMKNVISLTFEYASSRIFYSDIQKGSINTVFFNGTGHAILIDSEWRTASDGPWRWCTYIIYNLLFSTSVFILIVLTVMRGLPADDECPLCSLQGRARWRDWPLTRSCVTFTGRARVTRQSTA